MLPDFLGIGAQKAGSTWLHTNLKAHPGIWLPPVKEIHYFNHSYRFPMISLLFGVSVLSRKVRRRLKRILFGKNVADRKYKIHWLISYLLYPRSLSWYESLFRPSEGQLAGALTPA